MDNSNNDIINDSQQTTINDSENQTKQTLIDKYREDYQDAMSAIDNDVKNLIQNGQEMKGLILLGESMGTILEIHESLSSLYMKPSQNNLKRIIAQPS